MTLDTMLGQGSGGNVSIRTIATTLLSLATISSTVFASVLPNTASYSLQPIRYTTSDGLAKQAPPRPVGYLDVIEVDAPINIPDASCQVTLMEYSFANSYGRPFVGSYTPPDCEFNRVILNFTSRSIGRQFDRLAVMYLNDTEVWRTSTAEPTNSGIFWNYKKDVSNLLSLWQQPQQVIFDLGNVVDNTYTGPFNTTLTAIFFNEDDSLPAADLIIPVSAHKSSQGLGSAWNVPESTASNTLTMPRNAKRAVFSVSACGQIDEEFWWSNVLSSDTATFANNTLLGYSTFREVQLLIDGELAGVAWPFPIIFTGGVVPGFWRPLVGIDTYDLKEDEIDITPWLPQLSDGKPHTFEIQVLGLADDGKGSVQLTKVGNYWVVSGKVFLWLDDNESITSGTPGLPYVPSPSFAISSQVQSTAGVNTSLHYTVNAQRYLKFTSILTTSNGVKEVSWEQNLGYSNVGDLSNGGFLQANTQSSKGVSTSSSGFSRRFSYPLYVKSGFHQDATSLAINGTMDRAKNVETYGCSVFPTGLQSYRSEGDFVGARLATRQNGSAGYMSVNNRVAKSFGETEQQYDFFGIQTFGGLEDLYSRHVLALNGSIVEDSNPGASGRNEQWEQQEDEDEDDDENDEDSSPFESAEAKNRFQFAAPDRGAAGFLGRHPRYP